MQCFGVMPHHPERVAQHGVAEVRSQPALRKRGPQRMSLRGTEKPFCCSSTMMLCAITSALRVSASMEFASIDDTCTDLEVTAGGARIAACPCSPGTGLGTRIARTVNARSAASNATPLNKIKCHVLWCRGAVSRGGATIGGRTSSSARSRLTAGLRLRVCMQRSRSTDAGKLSSKVRSVSSSWLRRSASDGFTVEVCPKYIDGFTFNRTVGVLSFIVLIVDTDFVEVNWSLRTSL